VEAKPQVPETASSRGTTTRLVPGPLVPADKPAPRPPAAPAVARTQPAEPQVGKVFTIYLGGAGPEGGPWVYQFRLGPAAPWQTAPEGKVVLPGLKPGPLALEFRLVDGRGRSSPALGQTWTPRPAPEVAKKPAPGLRKGDRFYQEVVVNRQSACRVLGTEVREQAQFAFLSSFLVEEADDGRPRRVRQTVEAVRLDRAEPALQARLNGLLQKARGLVFHIALGPGGEVVRFEGDGRPFAFAVAGATPGELSFLLQASLDPDAWKELAQLTLFRPPDPLPRGGQWSRKLAHTWGPLGSWAGQIIYRPGGKAGGLERFDYLLGLNYLPPRGPGGGLPFQVSKADFRVQAGGGSIAFDRARGRVTAAEERFHVQGALAAGTAGVTVVVEVDEVQLFQVRVLDRPPAQLRAPAAGSRKE
jgi:hypothetical protein